MTPSAISRFADATARLTLRALADGCTGEIDHVDARLDDDGRTVTIEATRSDGQWIFAEYTLTDGDRFDREEIVAAISAAI